MEVVFCDLNIRGLDRSMLLNNDCSFKHVIPVNGQVLEEAHRNDRLMELINANWATIDGQFIYKLASQKNKNIRIEKISGSDFIFDVCNYCKETGKKIFLLGGKELSNEKSVKSLQKKYGIDIAGYSPPYMPYPFTEKVDRQIIDVLSSFKPDYIFVAFGMPKQEYWIEDNRVFLENLNVKLAVSCGGTFEMVSGDIKRAPKWIQKSGFEWFFRLMQEPGRLWKRYLVGNAKCFIIYLKTEVFG